MRSWLEGISGYAIAGSTLQPPTLSGLLLPTRALYSAVERMADQVVGQLVAGFVVGPQRELQPDAQVVLDYYGREYGWPS